MRWFELKDLIRLIRAMLGELTAATVAEPVYSAVAADTIAVAFVEGWRGEACHIAITDKSGKIAGYKIVDLFSSLPRRAMPMACW